MSDTDGSVIGYECGSCGFVARTSDEMDAHITAEHSPISGEGAPVGAGSTSDEPPEVVVLCGSTRFKEAFESEMRRLTLEGDIVISVGLFGHVEGLDIGTDEAPTPVKVMLDELHKRKIDLANRVHVIDVDTYIGTSTRGEIEYAHEHGKAVTYMSDEHTVQFSEDDFYRAEASSPAPERMSDDDVLWREGTFVDIASRGSLSKEEARQLQNLLNDAVSLGAEVEWLTTESRRLLEVAVLAGNDARSERVKCNEARAENAAKDAELAVVAECIALGLVFGWHPGLHNGNAWEIPQETGWWCRRQGGSGMDTKSFPTLAEALAAWKESQHE